MNTRATPQLLCSRGCGASAFPGPLVGHERRCAYPFDFDRLNELGALDVRDGCWIWTTGRAARVGEYPASGTYLGAHRLHRQIASYKAGRALPPDVHACHTCDVALCVNPAHIYVGDAKSNSADQRRNGRMPTPAPREVLAARMRRTMASDAWRTANANRRSPRK